MLGAATTSPLSVISVQVYLAFFGAVCVLYHQVPMSAALCVGCTHEAWNVVELLPFAHDGGCVVICKPHN
eukprot:1488570-Amphidinium_carterae.2